MLLLFYPIGFPVNHVHNQHVRQLKQQYRDGVDEPPLEQTEFFVVATVEEEQQCG